MSDLNHLCHHYGVQCQIGQIHAINRNKSFARATWHIYSMRKIRRVCTAEFRSNLLDAGEADAIYLAKKLNATVLIDEVRGRKVAINYGIAVTGSAAVLIKAKQKGLIKEVKPLLDKLKTYGYRMSDNLITEILRIVKENK